MLFAPNISEFQTLPAIQSRLGHVQFRPFFAAGQLVSAGIRSRSEWRSSFSVGTLDTLDQPYASGVLRAQVLVQATSRWQQFVLDPFAATDVDTISETVERVFEALDAAGPESISLRNVEPENVNGEHLAAVLRATYGWREHVPGWEHGLAVAESALTAAGVEPQDALYGLVDQP